MVQHRAEPLSQTKPYNWRPWPSGVALLQHPATRVMPEGNMNVFGGTSERFNL